MKFALTLLFLAPTLANAELATVRSGEHPNFTRITVTTEAEHSWTLGRTEVGYALEYDSTQLRYDLSEVYRAIGRDRLKSIYVEPTSGQLHLGIACACHIIPFEFNDRTLVFDIRPGPAPANSAFETRINSDQAAETLVDTHRSVRPRARPVSVSDVSPPPYEWSQQWREAIVDPSATQTATKLAESGGGLSGEARSEFQGQLVAALGQAATAGYIDMEVPSGAGTVYVPPGDSQVRMSLGPLPQITISSPASDENALAVDGGACPDDETVTLRDWKPIEEDPYLAMAKAKQSVLAEFDQPETGALRRAIRTHLYFGFGEEAIALAKGFPKAPLPSQYEMAIAELIEDRIPIEPVFSGMQSCQNSAALWAVLAPTDQVSEINAPAIAAAFRELPAHLKPVLALRVNAALLKANAVAEAEQVLSALYRTTPDDNVEVSLAKADLALHAGDSSKAISALEYATKVDTASPNSEMERLIRLVEAKHQEMQALDPKDLVALQSYAFEQSDAESLTIRSALSVALALSGDFAGAFDSATEDTHLRGQIWEILAKTGPESAILTFATGITTEESQKIPSAVVEQLMSRLDAAGLPNAALTLGHQIGSHTELMAQLNLRSGNAREAVRLSTADANATEVMAEALVQLAAYDAASKSWEDAGQPEKSMQVQRWANQFTPQNTTGPWQAVYEARETVLETSTPLHDAEALIAKSAETRAAVDALLAEVAMHD